MKGLFMERGKLEFYTISFIGRRKNNQDSYLALKLSDDIYFFAVADGMGGAVGGKKASELVLQSAREILGERLKKGIRPGDLKNVLSDIYENAQRSIAKAVEEKPELKGMGTTLSCVLILGNKYVVGNLGDSRVYLLRNGQLHQITEDHTYIQDYKKKTGRDADPNILKQYGHLLTRSIDGGKDRPDLFPLEKDYELLVESDVFLICSDGLITDKTSEDTSLFRNYILGTKSLRQAAESLVSMAYYQGSGDNISVVLAAYGKPKRKKIPLVKYPYPPKDIPEQKRTPHLRLYLTGILIFILIILGYLVYFTPKKSIPSAGSSIEQSKVDTVFEKLNTTDSSISTTEIPEIIKPLRWMPGRKANTPKSLNTIISWLEPQLKNDRVVTYIVMLYDSSGLKLLWQKNLSDTNIRLSEIPELRSGHTYKLKIGMKTLKGLKQETSFRTIKIQ